MVAVDYEREDKLEKTKKIWRKFLERLEIYRKKGKSLTDTNQKKLFMRSMRVAVKTNQRRIFVFTGKNYEYSIKSIGKMLKIYFKEFGGGKDFSILFACYNRNAEPEQKHLKLLKDVIRKGDLAGEIKLDVIDFKESKSVMGRTYNGAIVDLFVDLHPNDIGRIIETVAGGGFIFIVMPPLEEFAEMKTKFHEYITTIPWTLQDVPGRFLKFFIKNLFNSWGIYIIDVDNKKIIKEPKEPKSVKRFEHKTPKVPQASKFPSEVYKIALTQDQVEAIKTMEAITKNWKRKEAVIITADRGRGKSASLGIFLGALAKMYAGRGHLGRFLILVTAPEEYNVYTLFEFAKKTLALLGEKIRVYESPPEIRGRGYVIAYYSPFDATKVAKRDKPEVIVADEAAGIPVPILFKILEQANKVIYSSTIHGYEGAGRGFSVRFIEKVKKMKDVTLRLVKMDEPIRYSKGDPIEAFIFNTLLLKATPPELTDEDYRDVENLNVYLEHVDLDKWFLVDSKDLEQFIGIYVFAHYRNEPKDLGIVADAPHYEAFALRTSTGKIVTSILVAKEGSLPNDLIEEIYKSKEAEPSGHLVPVAVEKHYRSKRFPKMKGIRVVRIATHPKLMSKGLGSKALELLEGIYREKGYDWIGSGFGANARLIKFWLRNKFVPIHISPKRNKVSGEYTVVVLKPLKKELESEIREYYREFRIKFVEWLRYVHYDIEPGLARHLLVGGHIWMKMESEFALEPRLTDIQKKRLEAFLMRVLSYELTSDAINELVKNYFIDEDPKKPQLSEEEELILICRILQARTLSQTVDIIKVDREKAKQKFELSIKKLYDHYIK
ncbi:MAG: tRNA(Met) cytidine acetyltransferase TmcA [Candidatus Njordarchaeia archaeon]